MTTILERLRIQSILMEASRVGKDAVEKYGFKHQKMKCAEELNELLFVFKNDHAKFTAKVDEYDLHDFSFDEINSALIDEIADVWFTTIQIAEVLGLEKVFDRLEFKVKRLEGRMKNDQYGDIILTKDDLKEIRNKIDNFIGEETNNPKQNPVNNELNIPGELISIYDTK